MMEDQVKELAAQEAEAAEEEAADREGREEFIQWWVRHCAIIASPCLSLPVAFRTWTCNVACHERS